jgi:exodeoxyribonuclease VII small subunit
MEKKEKKDKINFEENIKELEQIVHDLESGNVALDEALEKFNKAYKLSRECDEKLKEVSESVNKILTEDGKLEEFTIEE